ncbi:hypothetical protein PHJA_002589500 [Phtheirospermum japonicum]|uniref:Uncharacterized protein n=1 Tax=Phtheirospermum japonicum TaxID=374723 RepID=A0A830DBM5_9LAMI|nr:hypothetical protein PHJA_002589500 [Phtheirospermum japonicum]
MVVFASAAKSLKNPKLQHTASLLFRFESIRTLLTESVKLQKLTDSDSGADLKVECFSNSRPCPS